MPSRPTQRAVPLVALRTLPYPGEVEIEQGRVASTSARCVSKLTPTIEVVGGFCGRPLLDKYIFHEYAKKISNYIV